ncbi:MAG: Isochorismatase [Candidatus Thorarchaeota archaeon]|nr:MAG: Isochorismatase [Candidatus Thorarchaeota archaeon]
MLDMDPNKTALVIVDMLNDFVRKDGALVVPGAIDLIPRQKKLLEAARESGMMVVYLTDNHLPDDPEFDMWGAHAVVGTEGAEVIDELEPSSNERVIPKRRYSGFFGTDLDLSLREAGIETIILVGVLTNICVMYTSADASAKDYNVIVVSDATGTTSDEIHDFALGQIRDVHGSEVVKTDELLREIDLETPSISISRLTSDQPDVAS